MSDAIQIWERFFTNLGKVVQKAAVQLFPSAEQICILWLRARLILVLRKRLGFIPSNIEIKRGVEYGKRN